MEVGHKIPRRTSLEKILVNSHDSTIMVGYVLEEVYEIDHFMMV
jgi:hypothetical protein